MTLTGSKMKIEICDLPSSPLGESLLILDADFKLDVFSSLRVGVGSVDSATLSVSSESGSAEEGVVERESGVLSLSWTTYSTMGMLSAEKGKERGEKVNRGESRYEWAHVRGTDHRPSAAWPPGGQTPPSCTAPPRLRLRQPGPKCEAFCPTISPALARFCEKM